MRVHQQAGFVLLNRPFSESSWIVEVFSREHGRLALMAKGARRPKSRLKGVLLPFQPLLISWLGKSEIPILSSAEINLGAYNLIDNELRNDALVCGFYCNELLVNLMHRHDPHPLLFDEYSATLVALSECVSNQALADVLRDFEQTVVKETGYGFSFTQTADGKAAIDKDGFYRFQQGQGFVLAQVNDRKATSGRVILGLAKNDQSKTEGSSVSLLEPPAGQEPQPLTGEEKAQSKHLMRDILNLNLGYKPIVSRQLFFPRGFSQE